MDRDKVNQILMKVGRIIKGMITHVLIIDLDDYTQQEVNHFGIYAFFDTFLLNPS